LEERLIKHPGGVGGGKKKGTMGGGAGGEKVKKTQQANDFGKRGEL